MGERSGQDRARYIFRVGKMLQHHIFSTFATLEVERNENVALDLSMAQFKLLMTVRQHGEMTLKDLAEKLNVSPPSVSVMVEKLVERKFLIRERSGQDRRKVFIRVRGKEMDHLDAIEEQVLAVFTQLIEDVGPDIARKWEEVLTRVEEVLAERQELNPPKNAGE